LKSNIDKQNKIQNILSDIEQQGWSVQKNFFSNELIQNLNETLISFRQQGILNQAGIGREAGFHIEQSIRNDEISWFDEDNLTESQQCFLETTQQLQHALNQQFLSRFIRARSPLRFVCPKDIL